MENMYDIVIIGGGPGGYPGLPLFLRRWQVPSFFML